jgi:hypothetical protein
VILSRISGIESAKRKVERARKHLESLELCASGYTSDEANLVVDESEGAKKLRFPNKPSSDIAIFAGEIIYQLRSALDHLAFELVKSNPTGTILPPKWDRKCRFPLCLEVPTYGEPTIPRPLPLAFNFFEDSLPNITPEAFSIVERLQPYNGGNGPAQLGCIEKLANIDKHHHFHVVVTQAYQTEHVRSRIIDSEMIHRLQDGAEIKPTLHDPAELQDAVYVQRGITGTFISFDEGALPQELADLSIDDVLGVCIEAVDRIVIPKFEGLLG